MNLMSLQINSSSTLAFDANRFHLPSQFQKRPLFRAFDLPPGLGDPSDMTHMQPLRNPLPRQGCFAAQPPGQGQFGVRSLGETTQILFAQFQGVNNPGLNRRFTLGLDSASTYRRGLRPRLRLAQDIQQPILE